MLAFLRYISDMNGWQQTHKTQTAVDLSHFLNRDVKMTQKIWYTYDDIHRVIKGLAEKIQNSGVKYNAMIAIGGGGFIPARMLRCFWKSRFTLLPLPITTATTKAK